MRQRLKGRCVLIVDDETLIKELCQKVLDDYRVLLASNGREALDILAAEHVDVVLSDVMMPDMDGLTLLTKIKEHDPTQVVIMMTGFSDKEIVLRALRENADDFLTKPLNLLQLKTTISKALDKKRLKEELVYLRRMDRLKGDFLGLVSHKLKTPVTSISLFLQNLAGGIDTVDAPEFQTHLQMAYEESLYLQRLINDLLRHSEAMLTPDLGEKTNIDISEVLLHLQRQFNDDARKRSIELHVEKGADLPAINLEPGGFVFTLSSLLDNAIKFSPAGGRVTLTTEQDERQLKIRITDQGDGIDMQELPKVFEKFYQVDPEGTGQVRGFGLGLYFARHYAQFHHGALALENLPEGGLSATLSLPL